MIFTIFCFSGKPVPFDVNGMGKDNFQWEDSFCQECFMDAYKDLLDKCNLTSAVETITKRSSYTDCYWCGYCNK